MNQEKVIDNVFRDVGLLNKIFATESIEYLRKIDLELDRRTDLTEQEIEYYSSIIKGRIKTFTIFEDYRMETVGESKGSYPPRHYIK